MSGEDKLNKTRESLQILILKILFDQGVFDRVAFVGGTALRILHEMRRYSEDLDFSLIRKQGYNFNSLLHKLVNELGKNNLNVELSSKQACTVHSCFIKFPHVLQELGLSAHKNQKLSIKLKIDTNPPKGWRVQFYPVTESFVFAVKSFDLPSLYATKLHACFFRRFIKGRDFYDLVWYLGNKIDPNFVLLNNAIKQTEKKYLNISSESFKSFCRNKLENFDFNKVRKDVERFLEDKNELKLLDNKIILSMI